MQSLPRRRSSGVIPTAMNRPIYLDYAATTPVDPRVATRMIPFLTENFGNPASRAHQYGWEASGAVEEARAAVAALIGATPPEIVWTSGATEGNNLAIKGAAEANRARGNHVITVSTEHKAVLDTVHDLERRGFTATILDPRDDGLVDLAELAAAMRPETTVVSVMYANNEIGVLQPVAEIGALCRSKGIVFHCDAVQAAGKVPIDVKSMKIDLLTLTAHKMYGPKGIGALYVCREPKVQVTAQIHGGGHERGMRSGTLPTHQIVGFGEAAKIAKAEMVEEGERIRALRNRLWDGIRDLDGVVLNGCLEPRLPNNLNVSFGGREALSLMTALADLAVSSGSACNSANPEPSHVLRGIGRPDEIAAVAIRFSLGRWTTAEEIDRAIAAIRGQFAGKAAA
jgi:cysteine desulfurase